MLPIKKLIETLEKISGKKVLLETKQPILLSSFILELKKWLKEKPNSDKIRKLTPQLETMLKEKGDLKFDLNDMNKKLLGIDALEEGFAIQTPSPKQGQDPMF